MTIKIEPASNSTQLTHIALDAILRELAEVSRLPITRLQKSIRNETSPIRPMYTALLAYSRAEKLCQEHLAQLNNYKETLKERKKQAQKLLIQHNDASLEEAFRQEFQTNLALEKQIETLEFKFMRIHNKCKALNQVRIERVKHYIHQYELSRAVLAQTLHDKNVAAFTEDELDDAFAKACHIDDTGVYNG